MSTAATIRNQIESALAHRIPSALTPAAKMVRPVAATGIGPLDSLLQGGLPIGAVTELVGLEGSGQSSLAASFVARLTQANKVCAWIDVSNTFDPVSASALGLDLARLLWVRCGALPPAAPSAVQRFTLPQKYLDPPATKKGLHGGGHGNHPRGEVTGLSHAVGGFLHASPTAPRCAEAQSRARPKHEVFAAAYTAASTAPRTPLAPGPWSRIEQALRTADLLLQAGGFSAIVLDMASLASEFVSRVPLATWHRYRLASERTQSSILLLTQHACARSSAELSLRIHPPDALCDESTLFSGTISHVEVARQRFTHAASNVVPLRKPPQSTNTVNWECRTAWAGQR